MIWLLFSNNFNLDEKANHPFQNTGNLKLDGTVITQPPDHSNYMDQRTTPR